MKIQNFVIAGLTTTQAACGMPIGETLTKIRNTNEPKSGRICNDYASISKPETCSKTNWSMCDLYASKASCDKKTELPFAHGLPGIFTTRENDTTVLAEAFYSTDSKPQPTEMIRNLKDQCKLNNATLEQAQNMHHDYWHEDKIYSNHTLELFSDISVNNRNVTVGIQSSQPLPKDLLNCIADIMSKGHLGLLPSTTSASSFTKPSYLALGLAVLTATSGAL